MKSTSLITLLVAAVPMLSLSGHAAFAADLSDGRDGYFGHRQPYFSGQSDDRADPSNDRADDDDDDGPRYSGRWRNRDDGQDDDDDDDVANRDDRPDHYNSRDQYRDRRGYNQDEPRHSRCLPGHRVKQNLENEGWTRFHLASFGEGVAVIRAERRGTGRPFLLKIDGCNGRTISARPVYGPQWSGYDTAPRVRYGYKD